MIMLPAISSTEASGFNTDKLRENFLIQKLVETDTLNLVYSYVDRMIVGVSQPVSRPLVISDGKSLGSNFFCEKREIGIINIGGPGTVDADKQSIPLGNKEAAYVGMGTQQLIFRSTNRKNPAKFYFNSATAHTQHPTVKISQGDAKKNELGSHNESNARIIYQYIHPDVAKSCQLTLGMTVLQDSNVWNTMPPHLHGRRMEVYFYFDLPTDGRIFHFMGQPSQTRHIVVANEQAVVSPPWSIHAGVGTTSYSFIWGMVGENQSFTDIDLVCMDKLK